MTMDIHGTKYYLAPADNGSGRAFDTVIEGPGYFRVEKNKLPAGQTKCKYCEGYGGFEVCELGTGISLGGVNCSVCNGKGYLDWIDEVKEQIMVKRMKDQLESITPEE